MARRTYIPSFKAMVLRLVRYTERYDNVMRDNILPADLPAYEALWAALKTFEETVPW